MQSLQYFTREGNVYTKKNQTAFFCLLALLLAGLVTFMLYNNPARGAKVGSLFIGVLGIVILLRATARLKIDADARTISVQPAFFMPVTVFRFEDFQHFLVSKQTFIITVNATVAMIILKNGRERSVILHQTLFLTKPLQKITAEMAAIMGIEDEQVA